MPTTTFIESGTDATQDLSFYPFSSLSNGITASDSSQSKDGPRSLKAQVTVAGGSANVAAPNGSVGDSGTLMSAWFRFSSTTPASITGFMFAAQSNGGSMIIGVGLNTNGTLHFAGRGATSKDGSTVLSANTWYRISVGYIITSSTNWSAILYINGVQELTTSNTDGTLLLTSSSCFSTGIVGSSQNGFSNPDAITVWLDSVYIDNRTDKSDCGNVHVTAKRPFANGTTNGYTTQIGSGGSGYGSGHAPQVNEQPLSTTNGWSMVGAGAAVTEEYNIEGASVGDVDISAATIVDYMGWLYSKSLASETAKIIVNGVSSNISLTSSNTLFTTAAGSATYPAGTGSDIGQITATTLTTVSLYECGIVFAYIPGVASPKVHSLPLLGAGL